MITFLFFSEKIDTKDSIANTAKESVSVDKSDKVDEERSDMKELKDTLSKDGHGDMGDRDKDKQLLTTPPLEPKYDVIGLLEKGSTLRYK